MNAKVILVHKHRKIPEPIDLSILTPYEDKARYSLDTRDMKYETGKCLMQLNMGAYNNED